MTFPPAWVLLVLHNKKPMAKNKFFTGQPVFSQVLSLIPREIVDRLAQKHKANHYCKKLFAYDHLVTMLYAAFFQCTSLREVTTGLRANAGRINHLGLLDTAKRSTLSDANKRRTAAFFADLFHELIRYHGFLPDSSLRKDIDRLFIIDSTTVKLFNSVMKGAGTPSRDGKKKGGAKAHVMIDAKHDLPVQVLITQAKEHDLLFLKKVSLPENSTVIFDKAYTNYHRFKAWSNTGVYWISRMKNDASYTILTKLPVLESSEAAGVLSDEYILLGRPSNHRVTPLIKARVISFYDRQKDRCFKFLTNDLKREPEEIAELYKRRWQIELLFKRIKQRYPLRYFLGDNENAITIQIWTALICDALVKIIQNQVNKRTRKRWSYTGISQMIKHHLMNYIDLRKFLENPDGLMLKENKWTPQLAFFDTQGGLQLDLTHNSS